MEQEWNRNGTGMKQEWNRSGTGMKQEWNMNGILKEQLNDIGTSKE